MQSLSLSLSLCILPNEAKKQTSCKAGIVPRLADKAVIGEIQKKEDEC